MSNAYNEQIIEAEIAQIGPRGIPGEAATINIGTVTTGAAGTDASVTNSGTSTAAILDFIIPKGDKGATGEQGQQGIPGIQGETGNGIEKIEWLQDESTAIGMVYLMTFTNGTTFKYTLDNGNGIADIRKTSTSGLVDTYTIFLNDNISSYTFTVTNGAKGDKGETGEVGNGIINIIKMSTTGLVDNYRINFTNGTFFDFDVSNAKSITGIEKTGTSGLIDTYKISFNDNTSFSFPVSNGNGVSGVTLLSWEGLDKTYRMSFTNGSHFDYVVSNGAAGQVEWGGVAGVLSNQTDLQNALNNKAGIDMSNLSEEGISFVNNSKALETGLVSDNTDIYADIYKYAHSTFDRSKFTVVGSPIITDNGIASGFSDINKIQIPIIDYSKPFVIKGYVYDLTLNSNNGILAFDGPSLNDRLLLDSSNSLSLHINNQSIIDTTINLTSFYYELSFNGTNTYTFKYREKESDTWVSTSGTSSNIIPHTQGTYLCWCLYRGLKGKTDLKQFSITVDGVEVFSGNKTGIDTIKPDDYDVVGSPVISADGIMTLPSNTVSYIASDISSSDLSGKSFEIEYETKITSDSLNNADRFFGVQGIIASEYRPSSGTYGDIYVLFSLYDSDTQTSSNLVLSTNFNSNNKPNIGDSLLIQCGYNSTTQTYYKNIYKNNVLIITKTSQSIKNITSTASAITIGNFATDILNRDKGQINLNAFKIYVDGNLVYQPCLLIPYTLSKTGSKVVDVAYRSRVADMYEQFGIAPYYTIDEANANFTLPMGEIYGMKIDKTTPHIVETYKNGASWYRVWSDGLIEQGGDLVLDTANYAFLKTYTSYARVFVQAYTNNQAAATNQGAWLLTAMPTTTGFSCPITSTYYEGGYWYARGY